MKRILYYLTTIILYITVIPVIVMTIFVVEFGNLYEVNRALAIALQGNNVKKKA